MGDSTSGGLDDIARAFVTARQRGAGLDRFPGTAPATLADAYRVQDAAIALDGRTVAGWKVGKIDPPVDGVDRLVGPIFADQVHRYDGVAVAMPVFARGFAAAEAEYLLCLGTAPDPEKTRYSNAEAAELIAAVHVGIEIASSPFVGINDLGPTVTVSDFGNNNGLVVGPAIDGWRDIDLGTWPVELIVNGARIGAATAATMLDGPFGAARFLFELAAARGIALKPGDWISSGAVTGVHRVQVGDTVTVRFDDRLTSDCTIIAH